MKYTSAEVKSGILVVLSVFLLLGLTFIVGRYMTGETHVFTLRFGYIAGLEEKAPVYFAGHEVGKVSQIRIEPEDARPVLVTVQLPKEITPRADSKAYIDTLGLMGEKFVELTPGDPGAENLKPGGLLEGVDPIPLHFMVRKMDHLADEMDTLLVDLNPLIARFNTLLEGGHEDIAKIIANIHEVSANLRDMTHDLKFRPWRLVRKE